MRQHQAYIWNVYMYYNVEFHDTILPKTLQLQLRFNAKQQLKN